MIRNSLRHMPVIRLSDQVDYVGRQRLAVGLVIPVNCIAEHLCEIFGPMFVIKLDPIIEFPSDVLNA